MERCKCQLLLYLEADEGINLFFYRIVCSCTFSTYDRYRVISDFRITLITGTVTENFLDCSMSWLIGALTLISNFLLIYSFENHEKE